MISGNIRCLACGTEKNLDELEIFPHEDMLTQDEPIQALVTIECQSNDDPADFRIAIVCHDCYFKLEPDMWISEACWLEINAITPFSVLPIAKEFDYTKEGVACGDVRWDPASYFPEAVNKPKKVYPYNVDE